MGKKEEKKDKDLASTIIKYANEIYKNLGNIYTKEVYKKALIQELHENIERSIEKIKCVPVYYKDTLIGIWTFDLCVWEVPDKKIVIDVKADKQLDLAVQPEPRYGFGLNDRLSNLDEKIVSGLILNFAVIGSNMLE